MSSKEPRQQSQRICDASGRLVQVIDFYGEHTSMTYFGRPPPDGLSAGLELTEALDEALAWPDSDADLAAYTTIVYEGPGSDEAQGSLAWDAITSVDCPPMMNSGTEDATEDETDTGEDSRTQ